MAWCPETGCSLPAGTACSYTLCPGRRTVIDDPQQDGSEPGAWADALRHSVNITVTDHRAGTNPCHPHTGATLPEPVRQLPASQAGSGFSLQLQDHGAAYDAARKFYPQH